MSNHVDLKDLADLNLGTGTFYYACRRIADGEPIDQVAADLNLTDAQCRYVEAMTRPDSDKGPNNNSGNVTPRHPAKWSKAVLGVLAHIVDREAEQLGHPLRVLDPFAGVGRARLEKALKGNARVAGVELELDWGIVDDGLTIIGDARHTLFSDNTFDAVITSPCYGNRMADHHNAQDDSRRNTYRHALGHDLTPGSAAGLQWGDTYRQFHLEALTEMMRVVRPGGLIVINMSDHIRKGERQPVVWWWTKAMFDDLAATLVEVRQVATPRLKYGANSDARVPGEQIITGRLPA
jgi:SAM-dependent methyltransferase